MDNVWFGAFICVLVYWIANEVQKVFLLNISFSPIVLCALLGLFVGKPTEGLVMGGYLQAIFLGVIAIGGVAPANKQIGSIVPAAYVLIGGIDMEAALAIAYTIGVLSNSIGNLFTPIFAATEPAWQALAKRGNAKLYDTCHWAWMLVISNISGMIIIFFAVGLGTNAVSAIVDMLPAKLMNGLTTATGCMTAVGIAIALKMCWQRKYGGFFFIGWLMYFAMGLSQIQCCVIAACIGITWYFVSADNDKKLKAIQASAGAAPAQRGGDFF